MTINVEEYEKRTTGPGKFEGEPPETAYFYDRTLDGDGETIEVAGFGETPVSLFEITDAEAVAFAVLAHETLAGRPGNVPAATGALGPKVLGTIVPGV